MTNLHLFDFLVIGGYFGVLLWISVWAARREKVLSSDYFLAGREVGWLAVGASLFASNIGSEHLLGLAGTGAASGLAVGTSSGSPASCCCCSAGCSCRSTC